jgi:hypothetical protein
MRKLTALTVALGFLAATSLPTLATPAENGLANTTQLSAQTEQKPMKKKHKTTKHKKSKKTAHKKTAHKKKAPTKKKAEQKS